ncbi:MAG: peptide deformylase [Candidatus Omnitrophica bacterium]|nr:peptide deformylase [Candidatus Omnitrophota bacterium]
MAVLKVVEYPDALLSKKAKLIEKITLKELRLIEDMIETMFKKEGVGIAAPQVGVSKRIIVISPNARRGEERVLINPEILESSEENGMVSEEGCLSLPGISCEVARAKKVKYQAVDLNGVKRVEVAHDFPARVLQHEIDHLNGRLIVDRIDFNRRQALLASYRRL